MKIIKSQKGGEIYKIIKINNMSIGKKKTLWVIIILIILAFNFLALLYYNKYFTSDSNNPLSIKEINEFCHLPRSCSNIIRFCESKTIWVEGFVDTEELKFRRDPSSDKMVFRGNPFWQITLCPYQKEYFKEGLGCGIINFETLAVMKGDTKHGYRMDYDKQEELSKKIMKIIDVSGARYYKIKLPVYIKRNNCPVGDMCSACPEFILENIDDISVIQ